MNVQIIGVECHFIVTDSVMPDHWQVENLQ
jgi:hypothetical protein